MIFQLARKNVMAVTLEAECLQALVTIILILFSVAYSGPYYLFHIILHVCIENGFKNARMKEISHSHSFSPICG